MDAPRTPVGRIVGAHGLKGLLKVEFLTDFPDRLIEASRVRLKGEWRDVLSVTPHKGRLLMKLEGVDKIEAAEALQWQTLEVEGEPELEEDEFLTDDLIGLEAWNVNGERLGVVDDVLRYPAHDVLQIGELLVPAIKQFVVSVDLDAERIELRLLPGMLEEAE